MIYDTSFLKNKYSSYSNIAQKISLEAKKGNLTRIKRGLYSDNLFVDAPVISNVCHGPSYLSFEFALSYYGLIPEHVSTYTSACFLKKDRVVYFSQGIAFEYRNIPSQVFPYGICYEKNEDGISYKIASKEKALCDTLYSMYPLRSIKDLKVLLFDNLRIDLDEFQKLDFGFILELAPLYHSNTLYMLAKLAKEICSHADSH